MRIREVWAAPAAAFNGHAALVYLFAGLVPGLFAYAAYAYLGSTFGAVSTSLSLYLGPIVSAVLSIVFLGEAPTMIHLIGGAMSLSGMWWSLRAKSEPRRAKPTPSPHGPARADCARRAALVEPIMIASGIEHRMNSITSW